MKETPVSKIVLTLFSIALAGCAGLQVDYVSDPPGATLYEGGKVLGVTPTRITYQPSKDFTAGGCMDLNGTAVKWASGATAEITHLNVCKAQGTQQHYVFSRPDVPGRDIDANFALQLQRNGILQSQANAANTAATLQLMQTLQPTRPQMNCQSYRAGIMVNTTCN